MGGKARGAMAVEIEIGVGSRIERRRGVRARLDRQRKTAGRREGPANDDVEVAGISLAACRIEEAEFDGGVRTLDNAGIP